ncbi:MAG: DUF1292 domain-containing protein [Acidaminococcaceae bacterium]|nr:DUF1292 domain-containing protein [Acidaminococcaceae bacterium]
MEQDNVKELELLSMLESEDDSVEIFPLTDDEGNTVMFYEDMCFRVGDKTYAILVEVDPEDLAHEHGENCGCGHVHEHEECSCDEPNVYLVRVQFDENGEPYYETESLSEDDYAEASEAYNQIMDQLEAQG